MYEGSADNVDPDDDGDDNFGFPGTLAAVSSRSFSYWQTVAAVAEEDEEKVIRFANANNKCHRSGSGNAKGDGVSDNDSVKKI